jgi:ribosome-associated protein
VEEKKGENILLLDIRGLTVIADYFVIASGTSERMLHALAEAAVDAVREQHKARGRIEGKVAEGWVLVDFGDVVLHLFSPEKRSYYRLEELWNQGKVLLRLQ